MKMKHFLVLIIFISIVCCSCGTHKDDSIIVVSELEKGKLDIGDREAYILTEQQFKDHLEKVELTEDNLLKYFGDYGYWSKLYSGEDHWFSGFSIRDGYDLVGTDDLKVRYMKWRGDFYKGKDDEPEYCEYSADGFRMYYKVVDGEPILNEELSGQVMNEDTDTSKAYEDLSLEGGWCEYCLEDYTCSGASGTFFLLNLPTELKEEPAVLVNTGEELKTIYICGGNEENDTAYLYRLTE